MGLGSLSSLLKHPPNSECGHTDGRWMVSAHLGGTAFFLPSCYVTRNTWLAPFPACPLLVLRDSALTWSQRGGGQGKKEKSPQPHILSSPLGIYLSEVAQVDLLLGILFHHYCIFLFLDSANAFNGPPPTTPPESRGFCVFFWIGKYSSEYPVAFCKSDKY